MKNKENQGKHNTSEAYDWSQSCLHANKLTKKSSNVQIKNC